MDNKRIIHKYVSDTSKRVKEFSFSSKEIYLADNSPSIKETLFEINNDKSSNLFEAFNIEEEVSIDKYNFISITGIKIVKPFATYLWYGKYIYFANVMEYTNFNFSRFVERSQDLCPVCGEPKGTQMRFCYTEGTGLPYGVYVCSKECLRELTGKIPFYRRVIPELQNKFPVTPNT